MSVINIYMCVYTATAPHFFCFVEEENDAFFFVVFPSIGRHYREYFPIIFSEAFSPHPSRNDAFNFKQAKRL